MRDLAEMDDAAADGLSWHALIRSRRRRLGLRQGQLADLAGVSVRTVTAVESGKATVRLDVLSAITATLGIAISLVAPTGETADIVPRA